MFKLIVTQLFLCSPFIFATLGQSSNGTMLTTNEKIPRIIQAPKIFEWGTTNQNLTCTFRIGQQESNSIEKVTWFMGDQLTTKLEGFQQMELNLSKNIRQSILTLPKIIFDLNGTYLCQVENLHGSDSYEYIVHIYSAAPIILHKPTENESSVTFTFGSKGGPLICESNKSVPYAPIKWHHNGRIISNSKNYLITETKSRDLNSTLSSLTIVKMKSQLRGNWTCSVANYFGTDFHTFNVDICVYCGRSMGVLILFGIFGLLFLVTIIRLCFKYPAIQSKLKAFRRRKLSSVSNKLPVE